MLPRGLHISDERVLELLAGTIDQYQYDTVTALTCSLNMDQQATLRSCVAILCPGTAAVPDPRPLVLVHGVFGSGKSFFLAVLLLLLIQLFDESDAAEGISVGPQIVMLLSTSLYI